MCSLRIDTIVITILYCIAVNGYVYILQLGFHIHHNMPDGLNELLNLLGYPLNLKLFFFKLPNMSDCTVTKSLMED